MKTDKRNFHEVFSELLQTRLLSVYKTMKLDRSTCLMIYRDIFDITSTIISESKIELSNESVNYIAQQYYDGILINENDELDPNIFTQRASLSNIKTSELALLAMMMKGTLFTAPILAEIKMRS